MSDRFRLTLAQLNPTLGDLSGNAARAKADEIEAAYDKDRLIALIDNHGRA